VFAVFARGGGGWQVDDHAIVGLSAFTCDGHLFE
jgi:hypothetical protein